MARPVAKPALTNLTKAPTREHPAAPVTETEAIAAPPTPPPSAAAVVEGRRVMHSARIPEALRRRVKLHAAEADLTVEDITEAALSEYLDRQAHQM